LETTKTGLISLYRALKYYNAIGDESIIYEVVVINDGSTDGSKEYIYSSYKDIHLLEGDGNLWWTGSINKGAKYAISVLKSDYLLLWNDDVHPKENYFVIIESLVRKKQFTNTIIGSRIMIKYSKQEIWSVGGHFNKYSGKFGMKDKIIDSASKIVECEWQPGMGTLIPSSIISSLKIQWDEKHFPQYHGDSDFTLQCYSKGVRIITHLDLVIYNDIETTGFTQKKNFKDLIEAFTSIKSGNNLKVDFRFYSKHGFIPTVYWGMFLKHFYFTAGYIKHSIFKL